MSLRAVFPDPIDVRDNGLRGDVRTFRLLAPFTYYSSCGAITVPVRSLDVMRRLVVE